MHNSDHAQDVFREAFTALVDHAPDPPEFDEISGFRLGDSKASVRSHPGRGALVAAAAAALVLVFGVLNVWLSPEPEPSADSSPPIESAESIHWTNPVSDVPRWMVVYELPEGGYLASHVSEATLNLYSQDGTEWEMTQDASLDTALASHLVEWVGGDFAVGGRADGSAGRKLLHYDGRGWREVAELGDLLDTPFAADNGEVTVLVESKADRDVLWVSSRDRAEVMNFDAPWPVSDVASGWRFAYVFYLDGNFVAIPMDFFNDGGEGGVVGIAGTPGIWLSTDGTTWRRAVDNPFAVAPVNGLELKRLGDRLWADTHSGGTASDPGDLFDFWSSADGVTWTLEADDLTGPEHDAFEAANLGVETVDTHAGLVRVVDDPSRPLEIQRSIDQGVTWESVQPPPTECHRGGYGESTLGVTQDFLYCSSDDGLWVGHFSSE